MNRTINIMAPADLRLELHQLIDRVDDQFVQAVHGIVKAYVSKDEIIGYEINGDPIYADQFREFADNAIKEMKEGKSGISIEELKERSTKWLKATE